MGTADAASSRKLKTGEVVKTQSHSCLQTVQGTFYETFSLLKNVLWITQPEDEYLWREVTIKNYKTFQCRLF